MSTLLLLVSLLVQNPPDERPAKLLFSATVERPRPTDYGVLPEELIRAPLTFQIQSPRSSQSPWDCHEEAILGKASCAFDESILLAGEYAISIQSATLPSRGVWTLPFSVPEKTNKVHVKIVASLRINAAGLTIDSAETFSRSDPRVVVSSHLLASRPFIRAHDMNRTDSRHLSQVAAVPIFEFTNGLSVPILVRAQDRHVIGSFGVVTAGTLKGLKQGAYCGAGIEPLYLAPGESMPAGEAWVMGTPKPFAPGEYQFTVLYETESEAPNIRHYYTASINFALAE